MAGVKVYRSSDASAPVLQNTAGSLIALLDACLVNGYGSKVAAGWTKSFSSTNLAAYRSAAGTNQRYLRVNDANTDYAEIRGYESMTGISTGVNQFPSNAQVTDSRHYKYYAGASGARDWVVIANEKFVHIYNITYVESPQSYPAYSYFGDFISYRSSDVYNTCIGAASASGVSDSQTLQLEYSSLTSLGTGKWICRKYDQLGSSWQIGIHSDYVLGGSSFGNAGLPYPHPVDGGLWMSRCFVHELVTNGVVHGEIPGLWNPLHVTPFANFDTFSGSGALAGKTFIGLRGGDSGNYSFAIETSDTWYA